MNCAAYRLSYDATGVRFRVDPASVPDESQTYFARVPMLGTWTVPKFEVVGQSRPVRDFTGGWMLEAPVLSDRARAVFEPLLGTDVEWLPLLKVKKRELFAVNVLKVEDALELRKTIEFNESRAIDLLTRLVFYPLKVPRRAAMFKVPFGTNSVFVTPAFVDQMIAHRLTGALLMNPIANLFSTVLRRSPDVWSPVLPRRVNRRSRPLQARESGEVSSLDNWSERM